jgi:hypothetical protein
MVIQLKGKFMYTRYNIEINFKLEAVSITLAAVKMYALPVGTVWVL